MVTIDKLDIGIYIQYARRTQFVEQINQQYHLEEASSIPPQTLVMDYFPKLTELDMLLGIVPLHTPWAHFFPPKRYRALRKSPFTFSRVVSSIGSQKEQEEALALIEGVDCTTQDEVREKQALKGCFKQIQTINDWLGFIVGRVGQFLQG